MPTPSANEALKPEPTLVARFAADLDRVFVRAMDGERLGEDVVIGLAVSGGSDSMAMLALAVAARPGRVQVATVNHGLRIDAAAEAALVARACSGLGVPHRTLLPLEPIVGGSLQRRARDARYSALGAWAETTGVYPVLTAHHADDQAETLLMRLNRASGLAGLSAIRSYRFDAAMTVLRPLLGWRRDELRAITTECGLSFVDDPSNQDPRHDRTRIRALLANNPMLDPAALAASAGYLAEAEATVGQRMIQLWEERWQGPERGLIAYDLPRELRRRLLRRAIIETRATHSIILPAFSDSTNIEALLDTLGGWSAGTHGGVMVVPDNLAWTFRPAPPRRNG